jgi:hypothetical protein
MQVIEQFNALCDERLPQRQAEAWRRLVTYESVRSRSRKRPLPMVRALAVSYLVEHEIATSTQAARFFGCGPRAVSAHRRRFYEKLFRKCFGTKPEILFNPRRDGDQSVDRSDDDDETKLEFAGRSELANLVLRPVKDFARSALRTNMQPSRRH